MQLVLIFTIFISLISYCFDSIYISMGFVLLLIFSTGVNFAIFISLDIMITASTDAEINFTFQKLFYSMNQIAEYYLLLQLPWRTIRLLLLNHAAVSHFLQPLGLQNICLPCPSLSPKVCSNPCPVSR